MIFLACSSDNIDAIGDTRIQSAEPRVYAPDEKQVSSSGTVKYDDLSAELGKALTQLSFLLLLSLLSLLSLLFFSSSSYFYTLHLFFFSLF